MHPEKIEDKMDDGMRHLAFAVKLCLAQYKAARYFAFEHPQNAKSWETRVMGLLLRLPGVRLVELDFCMAGMEGRDEFGKAPVRKTAKILTNSEHLADALSELRCSGDHRHVHLVHGRTRAAQEYPELFCRIVCRDYARQLDADRRGRHGRVREVQAIDCTELMEAILSTGESTATGPFVSHPDSHSRHRKAMKYEDETLEQRAKQCTMRIYDIQQGI